MHPNYKDEAEPPTGCFHSPIKVSLRRAAKLFTPALLLPPLGFVSGTGAEYTDFWNGFH